MVETAGGKSTEPSHQGVVLAGDLQEHVREIKIPIFQDKPALLLGLFIIVMPGITVCVPFGLLVGIVRAVGFTVTFGSWMILGDGK